MILTSPKTSINNNLCHIERIATDDCLLLRETQRVGTGGRICAAGPNDESTCRRKGIVLDARIFHTAVVATSAQLLPRSGVQKLYITTQRDVIVLEHAYCDHIAFDPAEGPVLITIRDRNRSASLLAMPITGDGNAVRE